MEAQEGLTDTNSLKELSTVPGLRSATADLAPGIEIVAGYRLIALLGSGAFGDVWSALAPGGVPIAMKCLRLDKGTAAVEAGALEFMKFVNHPNLLTIFGIWESTEFLVIGMELAELTLFDRLRDVQRLGQGGILPERHTI